MHFVLFLIVPVITILLPAIGGLVLGIKLVKKKSHRKSKKDKGHLNTEGVYNKKIKSRQMEKEAKRIEKIQAKEAKKVKEEKKNKTVANAKAKGQIAFGKGKKMSYDITSDNMRNHFISSAKDYGKKAKKLGDERLSSLTLRYNDEAMVKEERMIAPDSLIMNDMIPYIIKEEISVNQYPITLSVFRNGEASDMTFNNQQEAYAVFGLSQPMQNIETKEIERR